MTMPSPFEMGRMVGGNVSKGFEGYQEASSLDQILQNVAKSGNPKDLDTVLGQIIQHVSPEKQPMAMQLLKNRAAQIVQGNEQQEMIQMADTIEKENPDSSFHKMLANIYRAKIPVTAKQALAKSISGMNPFKAEQQLRLQTDSTLKQYNTLIKEIDNELKNPDTYFNPERKATLSQQRADYIEQRNGYMNIHPSTHAKAPSKLPGFNPKNPEHKKKAEKLYEIHKDKEKVRKELAKEFNI